jgi:hypothetical protein
MVLVIVLSEINQPLEEPNMNMHVRTSTDRTLLPRALIRRVPVRRYKFRIGAVVQFHDLLAKVVDRSLTHAGRQHYTIEIIGEAHGRPIRDVMGTDHLHRYTGPLP